MASIPHKEFDMQRNRICLIMPAALILTALLAILILAGCGNTLLGNGDTGGGSPAATNTGKTLSGKVTITGKAAIGETLTVDISGLTGTAGTASYRWKRADNRAMTGAADAGAEGTYTVAEADLNAFFTVTVSFSDSTGSVTGAAAHPVGFGSIAGFHVWLAAQTGRGTTAGDPVRAALNLTLDAAAAGELAAALADVGKYVDLDLSACTGITAWDKNTLTDDARRKLVTLVLPDTVRSLPVIGGGLDNGAFYGSTNLKTVSGAGVTDIGNTAFNNCTALQTADFPAAQIIGQRAFLECTVLQTASFPAAQTIDRAAFANCSALQTASFPAATSIEMELFSGCTALQTASFPAAQIIRTLAFENCRALTSLTLRNTPPTLNAGVFTGTNSGTVLQIHVGAGNAGAYTAAWGVAASTGANGNAGKYGSNHKAINIVE